MEKALNYFKSILKKDDTIVVACSGGPDSMCLLSLILSLKEKYNLKIICAHVNHNIREESKEEEIFVQKYASDNNIIFELLTIKSFKDNFQSDARKKRYKFFNELINKYNAQYLMTAHHGDDLMETILMRLSRGSNIPGYAGFKINNPLNDYQVIRPLIYYSKQDIIKYNKENNIKYQIDSSNFSDKYTRNRYRNEILPLLKKETDNIHLKYLKFSNELYDYDIFVKDYILSNGIINENELDIIKYNNEKDFIKRKSIELLIVQIQLNDEFDVTDNIVLEIIKLINSSKNNASIDLSNNFKGIKRNNKFYFKKED